MPLTDEQVAAMDPGDQSCLWGMPKLRRFIVAGVVVASIVLCSIYAVHAGRHYRVIAAHADILRDPFPGLLIGKEEYAYKLAIGRAVWGGITIFPIIFEFWWGGDAFGWGLWVIGLTNLGFMIPLKQTLDAFFAGEEDGILAHRLYPDDYVRCTDPSEGNLSAEQALFYNAFAGVIAGDSGVFNAVHICTDFVYEGVLLSDLFLIELITTWATLIASVVLIWIFGCRGGGRRDLGDAHALCC